MRINIFTGCEKIFRVVDAQPAASRKTLEWDVKGAAICYPGAGGGGVGAYRSGVIAIWAPSHLRRSTSVLFLVGGHYNSICVVYSVDCWAVSCSVTVSHE